MASSEITAAAKKISSIAKRPRKPNGSRPLSYYFQVGKVVSDLMRSHRYKSYFMKEHLLPELKKLKVSGMSKSGLHMMARFSQIPLREMRRLSRLGISWRNARRMATRRWSGAQRRRYSKLAPPKDLAKKLGKAIQTRVRSSKAIARERPVLAAYNRALSALKLLHRAQELKYALASEKLTELSLFLDTITYRP